jgi:hypothetical protein
MDPIERENFASLAGNTPAIADVTLSKVYKVCYANKGLDCSIITVIYSPNKDDLHRVFSQNEAFRELFDRPGYTDEDWFQLLMSDEMEQKLIIL